MTDLNVMMREQAVLGLQTQLDAAVTNGDTAAARKISDDLAKLAVSTAPKAPPYGPDNIRVELEKLQWFGTDPKKSARVMELGKHMDLKKFATAELFAAALVKAVEEDGKPAGTAAREGEEEETGEGEEETGEAEAAEARKVKRKTDGPGEAEAGGVRSTARKTGPWVKMTDAPPDVQKEIKRSADKFVSASATKEQRESFVTKALESHYAAHQRSKGKK